MKKILSLFALMMLLASSVLADNITIYCKAPSWWTADGAVVGVFAWTEGQSSNAEFPGARMTKMENEDLWKIDLDATAYRQILFTRMNPSDEGNKFWNAQTVDLTFPTDGKNVFTITTNEPAWADQSQKAEGEWSVYTPAVVRDKYYMKNTWGTEDWSWKELVLMDDEQAGDDVTYVLENVIFGATGVNINKQESDEGAMWIPVEYIKAYDVNYDETTLEAGDKVVFLFVPDLVSIHSFEYGLSAIIVEKAHPDDPDPDKYYLKNNWNGGEWTWKEMTQDGETFKLENVVFGGGGVNYNTKEDDAGSTWMEAKDFKGDAVGALDTVTFVLDPKEGTITATLLGKYETSGGEIKYFLKNNWNGGEWTWKEMTQDGETFKLENVVFGGNGVNYNTMESDANSTWVPANEFLGDAVAALDTVILILDPVAGTVTAQVIGSHGEAPSVPDVFYLVGSLNEWKPAEAYQFQPDADTENQYLLETELKVNDEIKVLGLAGEEQFWYPAGENYKVDEAHVGEVKITFRPHKNNEWEEFGGYFFIEQKTHEAVENTDATVKVVKRFFNGQLVIEKNGIRYNAQGIVIP